jgi:hypothetical protein
MSCNTYYILLQLERIWTSGHKLYRKILAIGWGFPSKNPKELADKATCTGLILYGDVEKVKQFLGDLLKVEKIVLLCPLMS